MQFVTLMPRSGETIPVNPLEVTSVRQRGGGGLTVVTMSTGQEVWVEASVEEVIEALEAGANDAGAGAPAKRKPIGRSAAENDAAAAAEVAPAAEAERTDEEEAELQKHAQRAAHDDGEGHAKPGKK